MMKREGRWLAALAVVSVLAGWNVLHAADEVPTTISVPSMHCEGCAAKVVTTLTTIAGVAKAEPDLATKTIKVTPKAKAVVSPKALWEAVEKADHQPTRL